jgi:glycerophosphoryl diester phosphodiesterase
MTSPLPDAFLKAPLAHRGYHDLARGIPENSRAAFRAAIAAGYGIELDVQLSKDAEAMVFHDYDLGRLTAEKGPVLQRTSAELSRIPLKGGDEGIPTLSEVLDLVDGQVALLIEIKDQDGAMMGNVGPLERAVARALQGYRGPVAVMSFNPHAVEAFAQVSPDTPRGLTTCAYQPRDWPLLPQHVFVHLRETPYYDRVGATFISHLARDLGRPRIRELKEKGAKILCWTIRSPEEEAKAREIADNITFEGYAAAIGTP